MTRNTPLRVGLVRFVAMAIAVATFGLTPLALSGPAAGAEGDVGTGASGTEARSARATPTTHRRRRSRRASSGTSRAPTPGGGAAEQRDERAPHLPVRRGERRVGGHRDAGRLAGEGQGRRALGRPARLRGVRADQQDGGGRDPVPALHLRRQHGHLHPGRGSRRHPEHRRRRGGGHRQGQHRPAVGDLHQRPEPDGRDQHLRGEGGRRVEPGRELGQPDGSPRYPGEHRSGRRRHLLGGRARRQDLGGVEQAGPDPAHRSLGVRVLRRGARRQRPPPARAGPCRTSPRASTWRTTTSTSAWTGTEPGGCSWW